MRHLWVVLHILTALVALCWAVYDYLHALYGVSPSRLFWVLFGGAVVLFLSAVVSLASQARALGWLAVAGSVALLVYFVPATVEVVRSYRGPLSTISTSDLVAVIGTLILMLASFGGALSRVLRSTP